MNIVYVFADTPIEFNCSYWRCIVPAKALNKAGHSAKIFYIADFCKGTPEVVGACRAADIISIERQIGEVPDQIRYWRGKGKVVVVDFDDAYNLMPATNMNYRYWGLGKVPQADGRIKEFDTHPLEAFKNSLSLCTAATTPGRVLQDDWKDVLPVYIRPNYIDLEKYAGVTKPPHEGIIIGWGGSYSHLESFGSSGVAHALKRICRDRPDVRVAIHSDDRRIYNALPFREPQKYLKPWVKYEDWIQQLAGFDIGIAPLHGQYDERRSWLKVLEYCALGIPWVASQGPVYEDLAQYGRLVGNQPIQWETALVETINSLEGLDRRPLHAVADACSILTNVGNIVQIYNRIIKEAA